MGQCIIISMKYAHDADGLYNSQQLGILTADEVGEFIELFGEVFKVAGVSRRALAEKRQEVTIICDHFPKAKNKLFEDTTYPDFKNISKEEYARRYLDDTKKVLATPEFVKDYQDLYAKDDLEHIQRKLDSLENSQREN